LLGLLTVLAKSSGPPAFDVFQAATLQMEVRPNGRKEAIEFVWRQPDAALTLSQKHSITAALAKDTDETASLYFVAPLSEQWVGTLKGLLEPTGTFHCAAKFFLHFHRPSESIHCRLSASYVTRGVAVEFCAYPACLHLHLASEKSQCSLSPSSVA